MRSCPLLASVVGAAIGAMLLAGCQSPPPPTPAAPPVEQTAAYRDLPAHYTDWAHVRWSEGVIRLTLGQERAGAAALHAAHILALPQARRLRDILSQAIAALEGAREQG